MSQKRKKAGVLRVVGWMICLVLAWSGVQAQHQLALGSWRTHLPFSRMVSVDQSATAVFFAAEQFVLIMEKSDFSVRRLDRVSGLSDARIRTLRYHAALDLLLIAYDNSNLDVYYPGEERLVNIADIKRSTVVNDRTINQIFCEGSFAYLACDFGLVKLDLERLEIKDTYLTPSIAVRAAYCRNDTLLMATDKGIFEGVPTVNLLDFNNWKLHTAAKGLPAQYASKVITRFDDRLFADINDTLMVYDGNRWEHFMKRTWEPKDSVPYFLFDNQYFRTLEPSPDGSLLTYTSRTDMGYIYKDGGYFTFYANEVNAPRGAVWDNNRTWYADYGTGAHRVQDFSFHKITLNAPYSDNAAALALWNNNCYVAAGGVTDRWSPIGNGEGLFVLQNGEWSFRNYTNTPELTSLRDAVAVAVRPSDGSVYVGSFNKGLAEFKPNGAVALYNQGNSTLQTPALDPTTYRVSGLAFDASENLWMSNYEAATPIAVLKKDGSWRSFSLPASVSQLADVAIDANGYKWFVNVGEQGIIVFDENGTLDNTADDRYRVLNTSNSELPVNSVLSVAVDEDGDVWVGTTQGTVVFECSGAIFQSEGCAGRRVIVENDDFGAYLLETEVIRAIAVDGADRKWFGTDNGLFVQSANGEETVHYFTTENSPLLSNKIIDLAINPYDGEVFIATEEGMISYRTDATKGVDFHEPTEVYAFPNPVRPDYEGIIAVRGLVAEADVKITDVRGTLVFETTAQGGQAIWDGRDYNGRRVASGVYLVFSARADGLDSLVTKLLFLH